MSIESKKIFADIQQLDKTANKIKEETENFAADLYRLEQCVEEMKLYWKGTAAKSFLNNIMTDFQTLQDSAKVFSKLSDDFSFAVDKYRKTDQKTIDIVRAVKEI